MCHTGYNHLLVQPKGFFREHRELIVCDGIQVYSGEIMPHIDHTLPDALLVSDRPAVYKPTNRLWRVVMISESCPIRPNRNNDSLSTNSRSPSRKQSLARVRMA